MNVRTQHDAVRQIVRLPHPGGETDHSVQGELTAWYVEVGDTIAVGQRLFQISWPGLVIDYTADAAGQVVQRHGRLREHVAAEAELLELRLNASESAERN